MNWHMGDLAPNVSCSANVGTFVMKTPRVSGRVGRVQERMDGLSELEDGVGGKWRGESICLCLFTVLYHGSLWRTRTTLVAIRKDARSLSAIAIERVDVRCTIAFISLY